MTNDPDDNLADEKWQNKKVAYHEAAHAVLFWNLGFGVERVWIDRLRHCGHAQPCRGAKGRTERIGYAVACLSGLAVQVYLEPELRPTDVLRSFTDFRLALADFILLEPLSDGEQLGLALALTKRTQTLVQSPAVRKQIQSMVTPLLHNGCLLQNRVDGILKGLTETTPAKRQCKAFVNELERDRSIVIDAAKGYAPEFRWNSSSG